MSTGNQPPSREQFKPLRSTRPATSLLSAQFEYTNSVTTDITATFERVRQRELAARTAPKVVTIAWRRSRFQVEHHD